MFNWRGVFAMTAREVWERCVAGYIVLRRDGSDLVVEPLFPDSHPIPPELPSVLRRIKAELLRLLAYEEEADALLLESTRRLAAAWPKGCPLEGPEWEAHEETLTEAYWSQDLDALCRVLHAREAFAREMFSRHRREVHHDE